MLFFFQDLMAKSVSRNILAGILLAEKKLNQSVGFKILK